MTREEFGLAYQQGGFRKTVQRLMKCGIDEDYAKDLSQSAWLRGWERLCQLRDPHQLESWVYRIAHRLLLDEIDGRHRCCQLEEDCAAGEPPKTSVAAIDVRRKLASCPPRQEYAIKSVYWFGYSNIELARELGTSVGAVHNTLSRARRALRKRMA